MFKKKVSAEVIAASLFKFLEGQAGIEQVERILAYISEPEKANVRLELKLLEVAAIDFGVYDLLGNTPEKKAVMDAFYAFLWHESERFLGSSSSFIFPKIKDRLLEYSKVSKISHELGPFYMIGRTFSKICGREDSKLAYIAAVLFQSKLQFLPLKTFLKEYKIEI